MRNWNHGLARSAANFLDNFSVKLDFFETVMYQVQFAASWKVMFDLIVTMAAVKANSNYFQTAVSGGICALLLFLLELYILVIYWRRIQVLADRAAEQG